MAPDSPPFKTLARVRKSSSPFLPLSPWQRRHLATSSGRTAVSRAGRRVDGSCAAAPGIAGPKVAQTRTPRQSKQPAALRRIGRLREGFMMDIPGAGGCTVRSHVGYLITRCLETRKTQVMSTNSVLPLGGLLRD